MANEPGTAVDEAKTYEEAISRTNHAAWDD